MIVKLLRIAPQTFTCLGSY